MARTQVQQRDTESQEAPPLLLELRLIPLHHRRDNAHRHILVARADKDKAESERRHRRDLHRDGRILQCRQEEVADVLALRAGVRNTDTV